MKKSTLIKISSIILISFLCVQATDGFTIYSISSNRPYDPQWETSSLSSEEELKKAFSQKFNYYASGGQCFVFFSEDQKYVLKFFKQRLYEMPLWLKAFPFLSYYKRKLAIREDKLQRDFNSYKLAFENLKDEAALLYVHLNHTKQKLSTLTISDPLGIEHKLPLDDFDFVLQRKTETVHSYLSHLMQEGKTDETKQAISKLMKSIIIPYKKGIYDRDIVIETNCGFFKDEPIKIDVGKLLSKDSAKSPEIYKKELARIAEPFKSWIDDNYPALTEYYEKEIAQMMENE